MAHSLEHELIDLVDAVAPPLIELRSLDLDLDQLDQLDRLVAEDERPDAFDGECTEHDSCRPIFARRLE